MKSIQIIMHLLLLLILVSCNSGNEFVIPKSDKSVNQLQGPVAEVSMVLYSVKRISKKIVIFGAGNQVKKSIYNKEGNIICERINYGSQCTTTVYEYNSYNQLIKIKHTKIYGYNEHTFIFWNGKTAIMANSDNDIIGKMIYDKEGNIIYYSSENYKKIKQYDKLNRLLEETYFNCKNKKEITRYFYKKQGQYETDVIKSDGSKRNHFRFRNIYDNWHNVVWQICIDEKNVPTQAIKYQIKYYNTFTPFLFNKINH